MSHEATAWAYQQEVENAARKFVLVTLADFADEKWTCFPGQERLAEMTGQDVRSVRRHLDALEAAGLIRRERRFRDGRRTSDRYVLVRNQPDNLTGGQSVLRSNHAGPTGQPVRVSLREPPASSPNPADAGPCEGQHNNCRGCGTNPRAQRRAARLAAVPDWCGECESPDYRFITNDDETATKCPMCHPSLSAPAQRASSE